MNKSVEQVAEEYARNIRDTRLKILDDFFKAYVALLSEFDTVDLQSICLVEQHYNEKGKIGAKYWFEYKTGLDLREKE